MKLRKSGSAAVLPVAGLVAVLLTVTPACADNVTVLVTGANGRPMADAVVSIDVPGTPKPELRGPYVMAQRNIAFDPHVLIVPVGATVLFPNKDQVRHHVYSFSTAAKFELKLYGRDETKSIRFGKAGVVSLGCNIHDAMNGFIVVTSTSYAALTDTTGHATLKNVPSGHQSLRVWHPVIRAPDNTLTKPISVTSKELQLAIVAK